MKLFKKYAFRWYNSYHGACGTAHAPAGQSVSLHGTVLHHTLTVCAHIHHKPFPCLDKHTLHTMHHLNNPGRKQRMVLFCTSYSDHGVVQDTGIQRSCRGEMHE